MPRIVTSTNARAWYRTSRDENLKAPSKQLVWFERSAHDVVNEEPGKMLISLVRYARPIAERAGDIAPQ